jgi:uncharacterized protein YraI
VTIPAVAGVKGGSLYGDSGALLAALDSGDSMLLTGRSEDNTWLAATVAAGEGWVQAKELIAYGLGRLPQVTLPQAVADAAAPTTLVAANGESITLTADGSDAASSAPAAAPITGAALVTETVTLSPAQSATATVATDDGRLNLRAGPGTEYAIIGKGENGATYPVLGRDDAGDWLQLDLGDGEADWASAAYLEVAGDVQSLPVQPAPALQADVTATAGSTAAASVILLPWSAASIQPPAQPSPLLPRRMGWRARWSFSKAPAA